MGKKAGWISAVKKALTFETKDTKEKKSENYKCLKNNETVVAVPQADDKAENEQSMPQAYSVAIATAAAAEAAAAAARAAAAEVAKLTAAVLRSDKSKEEVAAVKIQTAFRGHLARRALRALRGLARLKSMIKGQSVQRQSMIALKCMQTLTRVQSQIQSRRVKMSDDNFALQKHLQQKCEREIEKLNTPLITTNENVALHQQKCEKEVDKSRAPASTTKGAEDWNASAGSKEQIEAKLQHKEEAALRRERALAYAHSHQTVRKIPSKPENPKSTDPIFTDQLTDPFWGWSWLDRWMGTRPWEPTQDLQVITDHENASQKTKPPPSTPAPRARSVGPKARPMDPKGSNEPSKAKPEHQRRHTIGGSLVKDGDKMEGSKTVSSKVAKSRVASRMGNGKTDKSSFGSAKKQLSHSLSTPGARRLSGPAKPVATY